MGCQTSVTTEGDLKERCSMPEERISRRNGMHTRSSRKNGPCDSLDHRRLRATRGDDTRDKKSKSV